MSDMRWGAAVGVCRGFRGASGVAPFLDRERLHGAFAQSLDVIQEAGGGQNVWRPWNQIEEQNLKTDTNHFLQAPEGRDELGSATLFLPMMTSQDFTAWLTS